MIHEICKDIIFNLRINKFIETGTFQGETVAKVSVWYQDLDADFGTIVNMVPNAYLSSFLPRRKVFYPVFRGAKQSAKVKIFSVDKDRERQEVLRSLFKTNPNIQFIIDSSEKFIQESIDSGLINDRDKTLFYLDAHWEEYWPLHDEIRQILRLRRSIIVIDDFLMPFRSRIEFDTYKTYICGWYYIRKLFNKYRIHVYYPNYPNIDNRGAIFIFIGYQNEELKFMDRLPCYKPRFIKGDPFKTLFVKLQLILRNIRKEDVCIKG